MNQARNPSATARSEATLAADRAGVTIRTIESVDELGAVVEVFGAVWGLERGDELVTPGLLRAMTHAGSYVSAAFDDEVMVGACFGFLGTPIGHALHSHLSGVRPEARGRGIGAALKLHQREWALAQGLDSITWTFDPLVAPNAHLNISVLGAHCEEYLVNFYGALTDSVNAGEQTDRILLRWNLHETHEPIEAAEDSGADALVCRDDAPIRLDVPSPASLVRVQIPADIVRLRVTDPDAAQLWRAALRETLAEFLDRGWHIVGFDRERRYLLEKS